MFVNSSHAGIAFKKKLWKNGQTLNIAFRNGSDFEKNTVIHAAETWQKYVNLKFKIYKTTLGKNIPKALKKNTIIIKFNNESTVGNSLAGTDINGLFGLGKQDTVIGSAGPMENFLSLALHEIGHAIGLAHEHSHPDSVNFIKESERVSFNNPEGFDSDYNNQVFTKRSDFKLSKYDPTSVMHYRQFADAREFKSPEEWAKARMLSFNDKSFASSLYPKEIPLTSSDIEELSIQEEKERKHWLTQAIYGHNTLNDCHIADTGIENLLDSSTVKDIYFESNGKKYLLARGPGDISLFQGYLKTSTFCREGFSINVESNQCSLIKIDRQKSSALIKTPYNESSIEYVEGMSLEEMLIYSQKLICFEYDY